MVSECIEVSYKQRKKLGASAVGSAKCKAERTVFGSVMRRNGEKCDGFKIAMRMVKTRIVLVSSA